MGPNSYALLLFNYKLVNMIRLAVLGLLIAIGISACSQDGGTVGESEYATKIIGNWFGTVGDMKESISFNANGAFVSEVRPRGFISNTLGQGITGTIRGNWAIKGKFIMLSTVDAEDVRVRNKTTTSTIEKFNSNELIVKSQDGEVSTFVR